MDRNAGGTSLPVSRHKCLISAAQCADGGFLSCLFSLFFFFSLFVVLIEAVIGVEFMANESGVCVFYRVCVCVFACCRDKCYARACGFKGVKTHRFDMNVLEGFLC